MRNFLVGSEFYKKLFKRDPTLVGSILEEIRIDNICFFMVIDLENTNPDFLPREWHGRKYNTTRLRFCFINFDNLKVQGFAPPMRGTLNLEKKSEAGFMARFSGDSGVVELQSKFIEICSVQLYFQEGAHPAEAGTAKAPGDQS